MAWGKVDDKLYSSPKWMQATKGGKALWASALSWCMAQLTDGAVPQQVCFMLGASTQDARSLVRAGLWYETQDGYQFHDWLDYQPSREQVLSEREGARQRQQRARDKAAESRKDHGVSHAVTHGEVQPSVTGDVTVPPARPGPSPKREATPAKRRTKLTDDFTPSEAHHKKAKDLGVDIDAELEKFKNHFIGNGDTKERWDRTFSNWLTRSTEFTNGRPPPRPQSSFDPWAGDWSEDDIRRQKNQ